MKRQVLADAILVIACTVGCGVQDETAPTVPVDSTTSSLAYTSNGPAPITTTFWWTKYDVDRNLIPSPWTPSLQIQQVYGTSRTGPGPFVPQYDVIIQTSLRRRGLGARAALFVIVSGSRWMVGRRWYRPCARGATVSTRCPTDVCAST